MADVFASGNWHVAEGNQDAFVDAWSRFLSWTRDSQPGLAYGRLMRDESDGRHFVSFAEWSDPAARDAWRNSDKFMELFGACRQLCDDFQGGDFEGIVSV